MQISVPCVLSVLAACGGPWLLAACAAVKVIHADGTEEVSVQPFRPTNPGRAADTPKLVSVTAFGISRTDRGFDVGFRTEDIVAAPAACHAVFVVRSPAQAETAGALAKRVEERCIVQR